MASSISEAFFSLLLAFALFVSGVLGGITCKQLDSSTCAFAVSSSGLRCVLEKRAQGSGQKEDHTCRSSSVLATRIASWVETDECVAACGLDRETFGISSDLLLDGRFISRLCSPECYQSCPNVVDLYFNLAAGEGVFLPNLCAVKAERREMAEINSFGQSEEAACAPEAPRFAGGRRLIGLEHINGGSAPPPEQGRKLEEYGSVDATPPL
ncbi:uncharacterized protein LOC110099601 [Dendrobium catenatum]|uniref:uncharacterized protein LOC110099601 n=1 Tax=Dendrobium catenatum TaxID=906689 RepID=UPI0009F552FC|nr:uncharacterized protein LOC110099601 [Dendrobium catenatum]